MLYLSALTPLRVLCSLPALALWLLAVIPIHRPWLRAHITPHLHTIVRRQVPFVLFINTSLRSSLMDFLTRATEMSVCLEFYVGLLSLTYLLNCPELAGKLCAGLAFNTYLTSALKDLFCSPRPLHLCTKEQKRQLQLAYGKEDGEHETSDEYGIPSLHTSAGLLMAMVATHLLIEYGYLTPTTTIAYILCYLPALVWGVWIGLTRVYLGVHSPIDLALGAVVGASVYGIWAATVNTHLLWATGLPPSPTTPQAAASPFAFPLSLLSAAPQPGWARVLTCVGVHISMLLLCPRPMHNTESFVHATTFMGAWGGVPVAQAYWPALAGVAKATAAAAGGVVPSQLVDAWRGGSVPLEALRMALAVVLAVLTKAVVKKTLTPLLKILLDLLPLRVRLLLQPPVGLRVISFHPPSHATAPTDGTNCANGSASLYSKSSSGNDGPLSNGKGKGTKDGALPVITAQAGAGAGPGGEEAAGKVQAEGAHLAHPLGGASARVHPIDDESEGDASGGQGSAPTHATGRSPPARGLGLKGLSVKGLGGGAADAAGARYGRGMDGAVVDERGVLIRPDGYPWDAETIRRYCCYCSMCVVVAMYAHGTAPPWSVFA